MNIFSADGISKQFSNHKALDNISLVVPEQSIFGLLGPNGAGKTTFIRIINQIIHPDTGSLFFEGNKLTQRHIAKIGYLPEERGLYKKMKVGEQALYLAQLKGISKKEATRILKEWFEKFEIMPWWNRKVEELSKGMQQKVQFIVTILHKPKLLIFDEPFSGFDPINVNLLKDEILSLRDQGASIIFSTHNMASVEELCDHIVLINNSRNILEGNVSDIKQQFKTNSYEMILSGETTDLSQKLPAGYHLLESTPDNGTTRIRIQLPGGVSTNELLGSLIPEFEIRSFNELLPTMNDIFIAQVKKSESFNNKSTDGNG